MSFGSGVGLLYECRTKCFIDNRLQDGRCVPGQDDDLVAPERRSIVWNPDFK